MMRSRHSISLLRMVDGGFHLSRFFSTRRRPVWVVSNGDTTRTVTMVSSLSPCLSLFRRQPSFLCRVPAKGPWRFLSTSSSSSNSNNNDNTTPLSASSSRRVLRVVEMPSADVHSHHPSTRPPHYHVTILDDRLPSGCQTEPYRRPRKDNTEEQKQESALPINNNSRTTTPSRQRQLLYDYCWGLLKHFLPAQYPQSVSPGYASYAAYSFGASVAGSAAMVLSTQTLLLAVGVVGSSSVAASGQASVLAGALNWVLKDGAGQLGGVLYASWLGRTRRFDANPKRWRMVAALCLDLATLLEILSPYAAAMPGSSPSSTSSWVLPLACVANVLKNMGFLTASASRAALHQALARQANLGDVTAKAGSQATAAGLAGTSLGIGIATALSSAAGVETYVAAFCILSAIHQVGNYCSVQSVPLLHFNQQRLHILLQDYCTQIHSIRAESTGVERQDDGLGAARPNALTPQEVAAQESFLPWVSADATTTANQTQPRLVVGAKLSAVAPSGGTELRRLFDTLSGQEYLINQSQNDGTVFVTFSSRATGHDILQGMMHAYVLNSGGTTTTSTSTSNTIAESLQLVQRHMPLLVDDLQSKGWRLGAESFIIEPPNATRFSVED